MVQRRAAAASLVVLAALAGVPLVSSFASSPSLLGARHASPLSPAAVGRPGGVRATTPRPLSIMMGGANVPRVPYKAPGEQSYQVIAPSLLLVRRSSSPLHKSPRWGVSKFGRPLLACPVTTSTFFQCPPPTVGEWLLLVHRDSTTVSVMDGCIDGWMDGWMDGHRNLQWHDEAFPFPVENCARKLP